MKFFTLTARLEYWPGSFPEQAIKHLINYVDEFESTKDAEIDLSMKVSKALNKYEKEGFRVRVDSQHVSPLN